MPSRFFEMLTIVLISQGCVIAQEGFLRMAEVATVAEPEDAGSQKTPEFLKPLVNLELSFIKRTCEPSDEQMTAIVAEAKKAFDAMSNLVDDQQANQWGDVAFVGPNQERLSANPFLRIRQDAAKFLQPLVSEDQYKKYVDESSQRNEFEREAAMVIAIDLIDGKVALTDQQRTQLMEKLMKNWDKADFQHLQNYQMNRQYLPAFPDHLIEPILTRAQREILSAANQSRATMFVNMATGSAFGFDEDWIK